MSDPLPHPVTGEPFGSPVPPGAGWPGDCATPDTPVATSSLDVLGISAALGHDLALLDAAISVCRACPRLVDWRETTALSKRASYAGEPYWGRPVTGWGPPDAGVLVVGLAPAAQGGNRTGRIFTGDRSGDWLYAALHRAGLARTTTSVHAGDGQELLGARLSMAVHCAPPDNRPSLDERGTCAPWFEAELTLLAGGLRAVVALGSFGWDAVLRAARALGWEVARPKPRFGHGASTVLGGPAGDVLLVASFHPSQQNTFTGRLTEAMLDDVLSRAAAAARMEQ